jgi:hypothetical protein
LHHPFPLRALSSAGRESWAQGVNNRLRRGLFLSLRNTGDMPSGRLQHGVATAVGSRWVKKRRAASPGCTRLRRPSAQTLYGTEGLSPSGAPESGGQLGEIFVNALRACNYQLILASTLKRNSKTLMALYSTYLSTAGASMRPISAPGTSRPEVAIHQVVNRHPNLL